MTQIKVADYSCSIIARNLVSSTPFIYRSGDKIADNSLQTTRIRKHEHSNRYHLYLS